MGKSMMDCSCLIELWATRKIDFSLMRVRIRALYFLKRLATVAIILLI
jgi:hypothetical protein